MSMYRPGTLATFDVPGRISSLKATTTVEPLTSTETTCFIDDFNKLEK